MTLLAIRIKDKDAIEEVTFLSDCFLILKLQQ